MHVLLMFILSFPVWSQTPATLKADALKLWQKRDNKESVTQAIAKFKELHKADPKNNEILIYLTRSYFILADAHTSDNDEKKKNFEKASDYGEQSLLTNADYAAKIKKGDDIEDAVKALTVNEVPQMYWTAASIGKLAKATGIMASLKYKGKILALISRVEELKPDFFYGAVPRYWGSYYAVIPTLAGKDLKKSKKYFEQSLKMGPEYLGTKVLMAETYYVEEEDKKAFKRILEEVINDTRYDQHPELGPENRLEKIKAQKLLKEIDELF